MEKGEKADKSKRRSDFLIAMYAQLMNDINRHIVVVWQSVGVLFGAFAVFALVEKKVISLDIAASLIVILCAWVIAHVYDAGYWYNRNLVIIANIERQFLRRSDLHDIHYYFGEQKDWCAHYSLGNTNVARGGRRCTSPYRPFRNGCAAYLEKCSGRNRPHVFALGSNCCWAFRVVVVKEKGRQTL